MKPWPQSFDTETGFAHAGPPLHLSDHHDNQDESGHWTPHMIIEVEHEADVIHEGVHVAS